MTLRDVYFKLRDRFSEGKTLHCPVYINLREHIAQTQPDEALYRHAEKIGFPNAYSLIAAWRAGFVALFLDGFDELTPPQFASSVTNLRQARRFAVEIVRRFFEQTPQSAPIIIAGRESYFDGREEARSALGYGAAARVFDLAGFTNQDIERFLKSKGDQVPTWLPTRPLLLGYLANAALLDGQDHLSSLDPASGWTGLLQRVCEREVSQIWGVGFEATDLRLFIEGLATRSRKSRDGRGLEDSGLRSVFRAVFGRDADEPGNLLTCRLPGLGSVPGRPGAREFIDADFADAAASGDVRRFVEAPFMITTPLDGVDLALGGLGREMAVASLPDVAAKVSVALSQSSKNSALSRTSEDLISILVDNDCGYIGSECVIRDGNFDRVLINQELDFSSITFIQCIIGTVDLSMSDIADKVPFYPRLQDCVIDRLEGAISQQDVPVGLLVGNTSVETYAAFAATNDAVMKSALPEPIKVLLTILRKLFMQRGTGRQYSALRRGIPPKSIKYVEPIIAEVKSYGFAEDVRIDRRTILIPNRVRSSDAFEIINGPNTSAHPIVSAIRQL